MNPNDLVGNTCQENRAVEHAYKIITKWISIRLHSEGAMKKPD